VEYAASGAKVNGVPPCLDIRSAVGAPVVFREARAAGATQVVGTPAGARRVLSVHVTVLVRRHELRRRADVGQGFAGEGSPAGP
jgi:hypothetical protein